MKIQITLLLLTLSLGLKAQTDGRLVSSWKSCPFPVAKDTLLQYNHGSDYRVYIQEDQVKVTKGIYGETNDLPFEILPKERDRAMGTFAGKRCVIKVDDGYLVGFNHGEFGGSLSWFAADGKAYDVICRPNAQQFISREGKIYLIEGLSHMSFNEGSILLLEKKGKWITSDYLKLPAAPRSVTLDGDKNFLIATASSLLLVDRKLNMLTLHENKDWLYYLYPNSVVYHHGVVYVGMRGGVFKYDMTSKTKEWLSPQE